LRSSARRSSCSWLAVLAPTTGDNAGSRTPRATEQPAGCQNYVAVTGHPQARSSATRSSAAPRSASCSRSRCRTRCSVTVQQRRAVVVSSAVFTSGALGVRELTLVACGGKGVRRWSRPRADGGEIAALTGLPGNKAPTGGGECGEFVELGLPSVAGEPCEGPGRRDRLSRAWRIAAWRASGGIGWSAWRQQRGCARRTAGCLLPIAR
jgi:hypothetical protein